MSENGTEKRSNIWTELAAQVADHVDLAALELRYEAEHAGKKLLTTAVILILVLTGFIVLQVAIIGGMMRLGLSLDISAFIVGVIYLGAAGVIFWKLGRRDERAGPPFVGTQKEIHKTLKWIQNILS